MPGMKEVIFSLSKKGLPLGIISNAQFYTPVILNFFINGEVTEQEEVLPFDADLTVFSYKNLRSKPDPHLFEIVKTHCHQKYGISNTQILFVGNDMFRDVYPAQLAGFRTALFAGDHKSLRLREGKSEINGLKPDFIITDLDQLLKILI
jgi:putative hydrolase of the HAD superfamily